MTIQRTSKGIVHVLDRNGHRAAYQDLLGDLLCLAPIVGPLRISAMLKMVFAKRIFFATVPAACMRILLVAIVRALLLRPTGGLFLGAIQLQSSRGGVKGYLTQLLLKIATKCRRISFLAIVPYRLVPEVKQVTSDWVFDPQMWDLYVSNGVFSEPSTKLSEDASKASQGKIVVLFVGRGSHAKGFQELLKFAEAYATDVFVVVAGKVDKDCLDIAKRLSDAGMWVENRFITDEELFSLYKIAKFAWCLYKSGYDHPSGVFGRALQRGVTPIIRHSSFLQKFAEEYQLPVLAVRVDEVQSQDLLPALRSHPIKDQTIKNNLQEKILQMRDSSVEKICNCLQ